MNSSFAPAGPRHRNSEMINCPAVAVTAGPPDPCCALTDVLPADCRTQTAHTPRAFEPTPPPPPSHPHGKLGRGVYPAPPHFFINNPFYSPPESKMTHSPPPPCTARPAGPSPPQPPPPGV